MSTKRNPAIESAKGEISGDSGARSAMTANIIRFPGSHPCPISKSGGRRTAPLLGTPSRNQAPAVASAPVPEPPPPAADIWQSGLSDTLRDWAAEEYPDNLEAAFTRWCFYARLYTDTPRFRTWRTDFRRVQEAEALLVLAQLDPTAFFRRHRPNDGGWDDVTLGPPPLALTDARELVDA